MSRSARIALCVSLTFGGPAWTGCQSQNNPPANTSQSNAGRAGGNGTFGESTAAPGVYGSQGTPSTQPSSGQ